ncbi:MAG: hypothetical protein IJ998_00115 [Alistipes sp.]|nr:hypothetical protein [Alistipes sp.]
MLRLLELRKPWQDLKVFPCLLPLGIAQASLALLSLTRSLAITPFFGFSC